MAGTSLKDAREVAIKNAVQELFCDGRLDDKIRLSDTLSRMPGLNLFMAELSWRIILPQEKATAGLSENLSAAARDIHSNLVTLARTLPPDTHVSVTIDETGLPRSRMPAFPPEEKPGGIE